MTSPALSGAFCEELTRDGLLRPGRMLLFWSSRSPYVRKVMIAAHEHGLIDRIDLAPVSVTLVSGSPLLQRISPLGQIPTLITADRAVLSDSAVIVEYLDTIGAGAPLVPGDPDQRVAVLARHAIVQGLIDAMVAWRSERNRSDATQPARRDAYRAKITRVLRALDDHAAAWPDGRFDLGDAALASALEYGSFRDVITGWADHHPALARRYEAIRRRPSVTATAFCDPAPVPA